MFRASRTWIPSALEKRFEISVSLHQDMEANVKFISCNVPTTCNPLGACAALVGMVDEFLSISEKTVVASGFCGEHQMWNTTLRFSGRIFFYTEEEVAESDLKTFTEEADKRGVLVGPRYGSGLKSNVMLSEQQ
jgi:hypothetical protein